MARRYRTNLLVLSGLLCSGKTTLARLLADDLGAEIVSARQELLRQGAAQDRRALQRLGAALERDTRGGWLASAIPVTSDQPAPVIVDSAKTPEQIRALRVLRASPVVLFLTASFEERKRRYQARCDAIEQGSSFETVLSSEPEGFTDLVRLADLRVQTDNLTPGGVASEVLRRLDLCRV